VAARDALGAVGRRGRRQVTASGGAAFSEVVGDSSEALPRDPAGEAPPPILPEETLRDPISSELVVERVLGKGGMGIVYLARQRGIDRPVAVKTLHADLRTGPALERFALEARIMGRLAHPNIVPVHAYGTDETGRPFLAMKVIRGIEWARLIAPSNEAERARAERLDLRAHLRILLRVCDAIAFAHSKGVIHRDLKPQNVMIGAFGEVLVTDWGIALTLDTHETPSRRWRAGVTPTPASRPPAGAPSGGPPREIPVEATVGDPPSVTAAAGPAVRRDLVGTPAYLPPEMAEGDESRSGAHTDVFLLGGILYRFLVGRPPHGGRSFDEVIANAAACRIALPTLDAKGEAIPPSLMAIAARALEKDPERRWPSVDAFQGALRDWLRNEASVRLAAQALERLARVERASISDDGGTSGVYASFTQCVALLSQALKIWEGNPEAARGRVRARLSCATFALAQGDLAAAEAQLDRLDEEVPEETEAPARAGLRERIRGAQDRRTGEARRRLFMRRAVLVVLAAAAITGLLALRERTRARDEEEAFARRRRAVAMTEAATWRDPAERVRIYQQAIEVDPTWTEAYTGLSGAFGDWAYEVSVEDPAFGTRLLVSSAAAVEPLLAREPDNAVARYYRGYALEMGGRPAEALLDYRRAVARLPEGHDGLAAATVIALAEGRIEDAERLASATIERYPDEDDFTRRGIARFILGDLTGALADLDRLMRDHPSAPEYYGLSALVLLAQGERTAAALRLTEGLTRHPGSPHCLTLLAYLAAKRGDRTRAAVIESKAHAAFAAAAGCYLALEPQLSALASAPEPRRELGLAFILRLDLTAAAPRVASVGVRERERGRALLEAGDVDGALAAARRAIADDATDGAARLLRARALVRIGLADAARDDLALVPLLAPDLKEEAAAVLPR